MGVAPKMNYATLFCTFLPVSTAIRPSVIIPMYLFTYVIRIHVKQRCDHNLRPNKTAPSREKYRNARGTERRGTSNKLLAHAWVLRDDMIIIGGPWPRCNGAATIHRAKQYVTPYVCCMCTPPMGINAKPSRAQHPQREESGRETDGKTEGGREPSHRKQWIAAHSGGIDME